MYIHTYMYVQMYIHTYVVVFPIHTKLSTIIIKYYLQCSCEQLHVHNNLKPGSQYDAERCVTSHHASLKRCRNATRRWNRTKFYSCVANVAFLREVDLGQSLPTCPKIDATQRSGQRHIVNLPLCTMYNVP